MHKQSTQYRLYGRTRGRSNKNINIDKYLNLLKKYKINKLNKNNRYILDIGSGYGETTIYLASKYNNSKIISCEKFIDGNINLIKKIQDHKLKNIYIYDGNANKILDEIEKKEYFEIISIFFPDPWPKKKHFKRRLIKEIFFKKIYQYLKYKGKIYIATDSESYIKDILKSIYETRYLFKWENQGTIYKSIKDYLNIETKFYRKAIISGKKPSLFILEKI